MWFVREAVLEFGSEQMVALRVAEGAENHGVKDLKEKRRWEESIDFGIRQASVCVLALLFVSE